MSCPIWLGGQLSFVVISLRWDTKTNRSLLSGLISAFSESRLGSSYASPSQIDYSENIANGVCVGAGGACSPNSSEIGYKSRVNLDGRVTFFRCASIWKRHDLFCSLKHIACRNRLRIIHAAGLTSTHLYTFPLGPKEVQRRFPSHLYGIHMHPFCQLPRPSQGDTRRTGIPQGNADTAKEPTRSVATLRAGKETYVSFSQTGSLAVVFVRDRLLRSCIQLESRTRY